MIIYAQYSLSLSNTHVHTYTHMYTYTYTHVHTYTHTNTRTDTRTMHVLVPEEYGVVVGEAEGVADGVQEKGVQEVVREEPVARGVMSSVISTASLLIRSPVAFRMNLE